MGRVASRSTSKIHTGKLDTTPPSTMVQASLVVRVDEGDRGEEVRNGHAHAHGVGDERRPGIDGRAAPRVEELGEVLGQDEHLVPGDVRGDELERPPAFLDVGEGLSADSSVEPLVEDLPVGQAVVGEEVDDAPDEEASPTEILEGCEVGRLEERLRLLCAVAGGQVGGHDRARAGAGDVDPVGVAVVRELEEAADQRQPLDAAALKDPVGRMRGSSTCVQCRS